MIMFAITFILQDKNCFVLICRHLHLTHVNLRLRFYWPLVRRLEFVLMTDKPSLDSESNLFSLLLSYVRNIRMARL